MVVGLGKLETGWQLKEERERTEEEEGKAMMGQSHVPGRNHKEQRVL